MELNKEQVIKALECCTRGRKSNEDRPCLECPYNECNIVGGTSERQIKGTCQGWLMKDALSLIKELTEENANLHASCTELTQKCASLNEENERLRKNLETFKGKQKSLQKQIEVLSKENHLLLSKDFDITVGDCHIVFSNGKKGNIYTFTEKDQIANEMLEGNNGI